MSDELYKLFVSNEKLETFEVLKLLQNQFNYDIATDSELETTTDFSKRMGYVESFTRGSYFEYNIYVDKVSGEYYQQSRFEELYSEMWVHDRWDKVSQHKVMKNEYHIDVAECYIL